MSNPITGQSTVDIIEIINCHSRINHNYKGRELVINRNVYFNKQRRFEFNHCFNRNRYERYKR